MTRESNPSPDHVSTPPEYQRFTTRARALFFARVAFLVFGFSILVVPSWSLYFKVSSPAARAVYLFMIGYTFGNYLLIRLPRWGRIATYLTLCLDVIVLVVLLPSPLLATQLLFMTLFAILFPTPIAIVPPLLALTVAVHLQLFLKHGAFTAIDMLTLLWHLALNFIVAYVIIYLSEKESGAQPDLATLQRGMEKRAATAERGRLSREIHDGLGAALSSLIMQCEYLLQLAKEPAVVSEIRELKASAEEAMSELRRSLQMLRADFDLRLSLRDYAESFAQKAQLEVAFEEVGLPARLPPGTELALFRVLQESLSNCAKHADPKHVRVRVLHGDGRVLLCVADNGKGFNSRRVEDEGYGLENMRLRARELGGDLLIETNSGAGSIVSFSVPVTASYEADERLP